ncbi:MAG: hypothetical protein NVSMB9_17320 [Isosphaeraceae bacterium]
MKRQGAIGTVCIAAALASGLGAAAQGQSTDAALKDRVSQLVERLEAPSQETRKSAEESLIKLGPRALPLLPEPEKVTGVERKERLGRIRAALRDAAEQTNLGASRVTIHAKSMRLSEVLQKLQAQSGNAINDLRESEGADAANPALDLEIVDTPFLEALDLVCKQAEVSPNFFTGDGTIGIMAGKPPEKGRIVYTGPFRVAFKQISTVRDLQAMTSSASVQFDVAWEPRLRPMLLALKADELKITDDQGKPIEAQVMQESSDVVLRPDNPVAELNLTLNAPERAARSLAKVRVKAEVTVPAGLKTFRFPSLVVKEPTTIQQGDVGVTFEGTEVDEQVWKLSVVLGYSGKGPAFESYRQGLFNNRLWLQKADGARFEHNGGFSNTSSDDGKVGFEYLFVEAPGALADYGLVYETPSQVRAIPLEFEFKDVPLP